jgi:3-hydroxyacyl-[acyl-carrier-protein] dehydratase
MLRDEIGDCLRSLEAAADGISASFVFPASFTGFDGHFPGNPILPGICAIQSAAVVLDRAKRCRTRIRTIRFAKFFSVVQPGETLNIQCRPDPNHPEKVRVTARCGDRKVADIGLVVTCEPAPETGAPPT